MYDAPHYKGSSKLLDKVALITGGDSGIGRSVAVLFAREGADIAVAYLDEHEDAEETKNAVEREGRRCILLSGDVANPEFCKDAVEKTVDELGGLDILVNNAAFQEHVNSVEELTDEHFDRTIKTNLAGRQWWRRHGSKSPVVESHTRLMSASASSADAYFSLPIFVTPSLPGVGSTSTTKHFSSAERTIHQSANANTGRENDRAIAVASLAKIFLNSIMRIATLTHHK
jgi:NAD(P)-dependent dehydrogenase (short-subunit alcohol dehydrogenase family)